MERLSRGKTEHPQRTDVVKTKTCACSVKNGLDPAHRAMPASAKADWQISADGRERLRSGLAYPPSPSASPSPSSSDPQPFTHSTRGPG